MEVTFFLVVLVILAFAGCGIFLIYSGMTLSKGAKRNISWPNVDGKVISSEIVANSGVNQDGSPFSTFKPVTRFQYNVQDQEFVSIHMGHAVHDANDPSIQRMEERFPVGKTVTVHYDPNNPAEAFLAPGTAASRPVIITGGVLTGLSLIFSCIGLVSFLIYFFTH